MKKRKQQKPHIVAQPSSLFIILNMTVTVVEVEQTSFSTWPGTSPTEPAFREALVVVWFGFS